MSREEFDNILHYATKSHKSHLQHAYRTMREKHLDFSAAPEHSTENNETTIPLAVAHELADSIIPFDASFLYESATRDDTLYPIILPDNTVHFLISSLSGYTLFFDYDGIPFLSPATRVFSLDEIQNHMLDAVNQYRETHTLKAVELNTKLNDVAQTYAKKLFDTRHFDHEDQDGLTVADRVIDQDYHYIRVLENLGK